MATIVSNFGYAKALAYGMDGALGTVTIKVYKGTAPTDANTYANSPSSFDADLLGTWTTGVLSLSTNLIGLDSVASYSVTAVGTGTATWGAVYNTASTTRCLICDVGLIGSSSPITLVSTSVVSGTEVTLADFGLQFGYVS